MMFDLFDHTTLFIDETGLIVSIDYHDSCDERLTEHFFVPLLQEHQSVITLLFEKSKKEPWSISSIFFEQQLIYLVCQISNQGYVMHVYNAETVHQQLQTMERTLTIQNNLYPFFKDFFFLFDVAKSQMRAIYRDGKKIAEHIPLEEKALHVYTKKHIVKADQQSFITFFTQLSNLETDVTAVFHFRFEEAKEEVLQFYVHPISTRTQEKLVAGTIRIQASQIVETERLKEKIATDAITGFLNKATMKEYAVRTLQERTLTGSTKPLGFIVIDLDNFKMVNDTFGHAFGDKVIIEIARILQERLGNRGTFGRIGGDEFFFLAEELETEEALVPLLKEIEHAFFDVFPKQYEDFSCSCTIGASVYPRDGNEYEWLFLKADRALYRGKKKGKRCYVIYTLEKTGPVHKDMVLTNHSQEALRHKNQASATAHLIANCMQELQDFHLQSHRLRTVLENVASFFWLDRITIFQLPEPHIYRVQASFASQIQFEEKQICHTLDSMANLDFHTKFQNRDIYVHNGVHDLKDSEPELFHYLYVDRQVRSLIAIAIKKQEQIVYLIEFDCLTKKRLWNRDEINVFAIVAQMIGVYLLRTNQRRKK